MTRKPPYPELLLRPSFKDTVLNFRPDDYVSPTIGFFVSFLLLDQPGRSAALRVKCGLTAVLGAFTYAYIKSYRRLNEYVNDKEFEIFREYVRSQKTEDLPPLK